MKNKPSWKKLGQLISPEIINTYGVSAALVPFAVDADVTGKITVYFSPRDAENRSELRSFEFDITTLKIGVISKTLFHYGQAGCFDDKGVIVCSMVQSIDGNKRLYYQGWTVGGALPSLTAIGVAEQLSDGTIIRLGEGPILSRTLKEPFSCGSPFVIEDEGIYKMWYSSIDKWVETEYGYKHFYNIKYAESSDGINWERNGISVISYENSDEYAFGRPFVLKEGGLYKMWYCFRGKMYRIGYAESLDGINWTRKDHEVGIDLSNEGWDSEMMEYASIFDYKNRRYMLYNGNGFGKTGLGIAILEK